MDVALLVSILAPCLPYLLKLGNKAAEKAAEKVGESTWTSAQALWSKLHPKVEEKEAAKEAAEDVAVNPEDADSLAALRKQLAKLLDSASTLAAAIAPLLEEAKAAVGGVQIQQSVTGNQNQVIGQMSGGSKAIGSVDGNVTM